MVVVRPEYSLSVLADSPELIDDISRVEVLINQLCVFNCPNMISHYRHMERARMGGNTDGCFECVRNNLDGENALRNTVAHSEELTRRIVNNGVKHLKLQGRGSTVSYKSIALMLYSQMFKVDGPYCNLTNSLVFGELENEFKYFVENVIC